MDRLISEQAVLDVINRYGTDKLRIKAIKVIPSAEPKTAYWIRLNDYTDEKDEHKCSNCGFESMGATRFCPNCGSKMYEDKGILEQLAEKQNNLSATNKVWSYVIEKNGYVN